MKSSGSYIRSRLNSFKYAYNGLQHVFKSEHNFRIHVVCLFIILIFGILLGLSAYDWIIIALAAGMVIISEIINTAMERMVDFISPEFNVNAGIIKDIGAGAVLIASILAFIAGLVVFIPKINLIF